MNQVKEENHPRAFDGSDAMAPPTVSLFLGRAGGSCPMPGVNVVDKALTLPVGSSPATTRKTRKGSGRIYFSMKI